MSDENGTETQLNASEYTHRRRKILGVDDEGNLILGDREPLDADRDEGASVTKQDGTFHE